MNNSLTCLTQNTVKIYWIYLLEQLKPSGILDLTEGKLGPKFMKIKTTKNEPTQEILDRSQL